MLIPFQKLLSQTLVIVVALILLPGLATADKNWRQNSHSQAAEMARDGGSCIRETAFMRRNHFELIEHQRDITVHEGVRDTEDSLAKCINCHVNKDESGRHIPINSDHEFCAGCHKYTAVTIDCFSCHSNVPSQATARK